MSKASQSALTPRIKIANLRAAAVAGDQWGVIGIRQLKDCGIAQAAASRWRAQGRLHLIYPGVFAFGHQSVPTEGKLVAAVLHAGEGTVLSHATAAWWWGLIEEVPAAIHLSGYRRMQSLPGLVLHQRRHLATTHHRRFPITTLPQTFLDLAAMEPLATVRRALAEADYQGILDAEAVAAIAGKGRPGTRTLRQALKIHQPRLAHTRSEFERAFLAICETAGLPIPEFNERVEGWPVDALWRRERVIVELDGRGNHHTWAQIQRDRRKELALRAAGFTVLRYTWGQLEEERDLVVADVVAALSSVAPSAARGSR